MIDDLAYKAAAGMATKKDGILATAIRKHLGLLEFELTALAGRCARHQFPGGAEVYLIDGQPIVEFYPVEFENTKDGDNAIFTVKQNYRFLV
ncbi:hypothetical protein [Roseibium sp.]|uniref:hypothetical protein n=1 Tax=Roseibium sp. TaxID=1936156 RepID=UPI003B51C8FA